MNETQDTNYSHISIIRPGRMIFSTPDIAFVLVLYLEIFSNSTYNRTVLILILLQISRLHSTYKQKHNEKSKLKLLGFCKGENKKIFLLHYSCFYKNWDLLLVLFSLFAKKNSRQYL